MKLPGKWRLSTLLPLRDALFLQEGGEGLHLIRREIRDGAIGDAVPCPIKDVISLARLLSGFYSIFPRSGPNEEINRMHSALIDQGRHRLAIEIIEPSADERKSFRRKVVDRRSKVQFAVKPRFHGVLIGGGNIGQMIGHK